MNCIICKRKYNPKKANYGWHINKKGEFEKCAYQNMPMQYTTKPATLRSMNFKLLALTNNGGSNDPKE